MDFEEYIRRHYRAALDDQLGLDHDAEMLRTLDEQAYNKTIITRWMQKYGLFQGVADADRQAAVQAFVAFAKSAPRAPRITLLEVHREYEALYAALFQAVERRWTSAASKLLWCLYPHDVAIYDTFVWRTLVVFQELDEEMRALERIGSPPGKKGNGAKSDLVPAGAAHYRHYSRLVDILFQRHRGLLGELRQCDGVQYPYDIRILDKLLWMIGNPDKRFPDSTQAP